MPPLVLELGNIRDPATRRAFENLILQIPGLVTTTGGGGGGAPSGPAGGVLGGTYPNPGFAADMATQAELDTHTGLTTTAHGGIVASTDPRLTDARVPTAHKTTHEPGGTDAMTVDAVAATGSLRTLGTGAQQAAAGNDSRLSNARTPTAHATTHQPGGTDAMAVDAVAATGSLRTLGTGAQQATAGNDTRLSNARTPTAHATSHQPGGSDAMAVDAAAATGSLRTLGTGAAQAAAGNDARLSDARTPTAHTHPAADVVSGVLATARLGSGTPAAGTYVDGGTGAWETLPAGGGGGSSGTGAFSAYRSTAVTNATGTVVVYNSEDFDVSGWYDVATGRFTPLTSGYYRFSWGHTLSSGTQLAQDGWMQTYLRKNGAVWKAGSISFQRGTAAAAASFGSAIAFANGSTDFFDIRLDQNTGAATGATVGSAFTYFQGELITEGAIPSVFVATPKQAADVTNATTTNVNTDLVFSFDANSTYIVDLYLMVTAAAITTGVAFAWDTSVAVTAANLTFEHQLAAAGTLTGGDAIADDTVRGLSSGVPVAAAITPIIGSGIIITGANPGTARVRFRPEVAASATFKAGSAMRVMAV